MDFDVLYKTGIGASAKVSIAKELKMDSELYERSNPVPKTAVATLFQLAGAGYEKSEEILKRLGFQKDDYAWSLGEGDELEKICLLANRESRYVALNNVALESGCDVVFDLPCGYVHRAFDMVEKGIKYVGGDLPEVINRMQPVIRDMLPPEQRSKVRLAEVDITNEKSILDALEGMWGSVCVCTEGLLGYLNASEMKTVIQNIFRLLKIRGGCWVTVDPEAVARHLVVYSAIDEDRASEIFRKEKNGFSRDSQMDLASINALFLKKDGTLPDEADYSRYEQQFLQNGLLVEKIPFTRGGYELRSFAFLQPEVIEKLKKALSGIHVWKFTVNPDFLSEKSDHSEDSKDPEVSIEGFRFRTETVGDILRFILSGRLDSLGAPLLLKVWEEKKASGEFHRVEIDCKNLRYISSAGLRVLLIIRKALPGEQPLILLHVSKEVREILDSAGFTEIIRVE